MHLFQGLGLCEIAGQLEQLSSHGRMRTAQRLKRQFKVVVEKKDLENRLNSELQTLQTKVRINGFRPGKVPLQHLRKMYGKSFMAEVVNEDSCIACGECLEECPMGAITEISED